MSPNSFGSRFIITTFGESHGPAMGVVIDGCPSGIRFDEKLVAQQLERRRPGLSAITSSRNEDDKFEVLSGVFEGKTIGTPIAIVIRNCDQRSSDYDNIKTKSRPGHADDVWKTKFGHVDHRGGGRASGRETVCRVTAGAVAKMVLNELCPKLTVEAFAKQIGDLKISNRTSPYGDSRVVELLTEAKEKGNSYGGIVEVNVENPPMSLGQPVFHKLKADLAAAYMGIGATIGVEFGDGFLAAQEEGSKWHSMDQSGYGGLRGGISTGESIVARIAFKPTSSVLDVAKAGRHDPCIVPRAIPVVEAMTNLVLVDHLLWSRTDQR